MLHIVDDDADLRDALVWMAKSRQLPCVAYASGEQFLGALASYGRNGSGTAAEHAAQFSFDPKGDCVLLDVRMAGISGIATFDLLAELPISKRLPVIFITGHGDVPMAVDALKRGAFDFFEKPFNDNALFDRVQEALELSRQAGEMAVVYQRLANLTTREREVLDLILLGKMNKLIADQLGISMRTVEVHRANIFDKMEVKTAVELAGLLK
ncbi:response regulator transcription factor [Solimicrobium silvestre]|uniref:Response regulator n=1 Tax=Solimicrobium silvestre TaxID=2099400 RepID=A0A2S9H0U8_9BURK|nr:response regulator [Solimicrobium silvestre]PRC93588.1 Response regulator [Solimicrobium silvestre]